jgi:hypothetical protein
MEGVMPERLEWFDPEKFKKPRNRRTKVQMDEFKDALLEYWRETERAFGVRGWCYWLEGRGLITKAQFKATERSITNMRKSGIIPVNICSEDDARLAENLEQLDPYTPDQFAYRKARGVLNSAESYDPISFWEYQDTYCEMWVEKIDLVVLFRDLCGEYHLPIANIKASCDIHMRVAALERFRLWKTKGKRCVLLYWGDFDPPGVKIAEALRNNFAELQNAAVFEEGETLSVGYDEHLFDILHVGLSAKQVTDLGLMWIEGLTTGSGENLANPKHPNYSKYNVKEWIARYGENKVEANALVGKSAKRCPMHYEKCCGQSSATYTTVAQYTPEQFTPEGPLNHGQDRGTNPGEGRNGKAVSYE